jgi:hypothetical protein
MIKVEQPPKKELRVKLLDPYKMSLNEMFALGQNLLAKEKMKSYRYINLRIK